MKNVNLESEDNKIGTYTSSIYNEVFKTDFAITDISDVINGTFKKEIQLFINNEPTIMNNIRNNNLIILTNKYNVSMDTAKHVEELIFNAFRYDVFEYCQKLEYMNELV